tara:strand:+ start:90 stop:1829 length:1740 start_codon:yes stop_codon:yes gene_type:complete
MFKKKFSNKINLYNFSYVIILAFVIFYYQIVDYGLPYFINADEIAGMKSLLFFYGFFTYANQNIVEPIYYPLINFVSTIIITGIKNLFLWNFSVSELKDYIFLNPDQLYLSGRISSIIFCSLSFILFLLICRKLKLNNWFVFFSTISLSCSYLFMDIAIVLGKNSLLLLVFLLQYYFLIKFNNKISKFNFKSYVLFSVLASLAWGINYWAASVAFYSIIYLHLKKFNLKKINYLIIFFIVFFILGFLTNIFISGDKIYHHLFNPEYISLHTGTNRMGIFFNDIFESFKIFFNFEKAILIIFFICFFTYMYLSKITDKDFILLNLFLIFEPILLFAIADYSYPQLRYFGPSIFIIYILSGYILKKIEVKSYKKGKLILTTSCVILITFSFNKINILKKVNNIVHNNFIQYKMLKDYKPPSKIFYFSSMMIYRESLDNLKHYKFFLENNLISLNEDADNKNNLFEIKKKIEVIKNINNPNISPSGAGYTFFGGEYLIDDKKAFFDYIEKKFNFIMINQSDVDLIPYLKSRFKIEKVYKVKNFPHLRYLTLILKENFHFKSIKEYEKLGINMVVFKTNKINE